LSLESVRAWLAAHAPDLPLIEVAESTATVETAARALGVEPGRIAKTLAVPGHPVGGVCPFGLATKLPVYCDVSLRDFDLVYPAAGSLNSSVEVTPQHLFELVGERWVDLCRLRDPD